MLTTKQKVFLAGQAQGLIVFLRSAFGKTYLADVHRKRLRWELDLREGIDFSIYLLGAFEPGTARTLAKLLKQNDIAFDIGANMGAHTLAMAQSVGPAGKVFAIEPADFAFAKLRRNLALNPELEGRVQAAQIFFGRSATSLPPAEVYASWPLGNDAAVHPKHRGRLVSAGQSTMDTLDSFVQRQQLSRLDVIKIDVDGQELPVLQGGLATLRRFRPVLVMEIAPYVHAEHNNSFAEFVELLKGIEYSLSDADTGEPIPLDAGDLERMIPDGASINAVARADKVAEPVARLDAAIL